MSTPIGPDGLPVPQPSNAPDGPGAFRELVDRLNELRAGLVVTDLDALDDLSAVEFEGRIVNVDEGGANFQSQDGVWVQITPARFASSAARDTAYAKGGGLFRTQGALVRRTDLNVTEEWYSLYNIGGNPGGATAAGWYQRPGRAFSEATGSVVLGAGLANGSNVTTAVVFPTNRFTVPPLVFMETNGVVMTFFGGLTTAGFNFGIANRSGAALVNNVTGYWRAVQMTPSSAEG